MINLMRLKGVKVTVKEYAEEHGVSKQSVYDRINRGTLQIEMIDGVRHIIGSRSQVKEVESPVIGIDRECQKALEKALKKHLKAKHRLDLATVQLKSMETLIESKDSEIESLKRSLHMADAVISKKLLLMDHGSEIIDIDEEIPTKKSKKKGKRKKGKK